MNVSRDCWLQCLSGCQTRSARPLCRVFYECGTMHIFNGKQCSNEIGKLVVLHLGTDSFVSSNDTFVAWQRPHFITSPSSMQLSFSFAGIPVVSSSVYVAIRKGQQQIKCSVRASLHCWKQFAVSLLDMSARLHIETCSEGSIKWRSRIVIILTMVWSCDCGHQFIGRTKQITQPLQ
jgi:hypothetical protein